jgi:hypothetical protein
MKTQKQVLAHHFKTRKTITQDEATKKLGIARLSERIREMEWQGWEFAHLMVNVPTRYRSARVCKYVLIKMPKVKR